MKKPGSGGRMDDLKRASPLGRLHRASPPRRDASPELAPPPVEALPPPVAGQRTGLLGALGLAVTVLGTMSAPPAPSSLVMALDQSDPLVDEVATLCLEVGGVLSLKLADASLQLRINPLAIAALVLAWRAPALLAALTRGRPLPELLDAAPLSPADLRQPLDLARAGSADPSLAPGEVRGRVVGYLTQLGVPDAGAVAAQIEARVVQAMDGRVRPDMFVSYAHADGDALPLAIHAALGAEKRVVFWDSQAFIGGAQWRPVLLDMLRRARLFVLLVGAGFERSHWQQQEMIAAIDRQHSSKGAPRLVPVCIDGAPLPFGLLGRHCLRYLSDDPPAALIGELRRALDAA